MKENEYVILLHWRFDYAMAPYNSKEYHLVMSGEAMNHYSLGSMNITTSKIVEVTAIESGIGLIAKTKNTSYQLLYSNIELKSKEDLNEVLEKLQLANEFNLVREVFGFWGKLNDIKPEDSYNLLKISFSTLHQMITDNRLSIVERNIYDALIARVKDLTNEIDNHQNFGGFFDFYSSNELPYGYIRSSMINGVISEKDDYWFVPNVQVHLSSFGRDSFLVRGTIVQEFRYFLYNNEVYVYQYIAFKDIGIRNNGKAPLKLTVKGVKTILQEGEIGFLPANAIKDRLTEELNESNDLIW